MSFELVQEYKEKVPELLGQTRLSFLIGAGCSRCAGLPLMDSLTHQICTRLSPIRTRDKDKRIAFTLLKEINERFAGTNNTSIEDFLSEIQDIDAILQRQTIKGVHDPSYALKRYKCTAEHTQILLKEIKSTIGEILGAKVSTIIYHRNFCKAIHFDLVKDRHRGKHPVNYFILNYDTLFEDALALEHVAFNDGFVGGATAWWDPKRFGGEEFTLGEIGH